MTFDEIKDVSFCEVRALLDQSLKDGSLDEESYYTLLGKHADYNEPKEKIKRLQAELARTKRALDLAGGYLVAIIETNGEYAVKQAKLALTKIKKELGGE
jgi:hypothetical protein